MEVVMASSVHSVSCATELKQRSRTVFSHLNFNAVMFSPLKLLAAVVGVRHANEVRPSFEAAGRLKKTS
jgi:hypothetical protein